MDRRAFLQSSLIATAAVAGLPATVLAARGSGRNEVDGLVRMLEDTPRDRLQEFLAGRIRLGLSYEHLLPALCLAGVRNVAPYPVVGFKFHAVMVMQAVHLATLRLPRADRWLPVLWAADVFKASQAADARNGDWAMTTVDEGRVPRAEDAESALVQAMRRWDADQADVAIAGLCRTKAPQAVFDLLFGFCCRDFRGIGHKTITVANCHRLLGLIGWQNAEPMLRSCVYAALNHNGEPDPASSDLLPDRPWRRAQELAERFPRNWQNGRYESSAVAGMLAILREGSDEDAAMAVVTFLRDGISSDALWDALLSGAGELILMQSGIVSVHANTAANAMHYAYRMAADDRTRRLLLLQCAAFLVLFRNLLRGRRRDLSIDGFAMSEGFDGEPQDRLNEIYAEASRDRVVAARKAALFLADGGAPAALMDLGRKYTVYKATGYHDYKFTEAAFENYAHMSAPWRERYLAASLLYLNGADDAPNRVVEQARVLLS